MNTPNIDDVNKYFDLKKEYHLNDRQHVNLHLSKSAADLARVITTGNNQTVICHCDGTSQAVRDCLQSNRPEGLATRIAKEDEPTRRHLEMVNNCGREAFDRITQKIAENS